MIKFGIIGLGKIAHKFLKTLNELNIEIEGVASRDLNKALIYQQKYQANNAYGNYLDLVNNPNIDAIYIATPIALHYEQIKLCLNHNKHVLVEKSFCLNAKEAKEVFDLAKKKNLLLMEAMWTRFLPAILHLEEIIKNKIYGDILSIKAFFNFKGNLDKNLRLTNKELGGGALLDVGVYNLTLAEILLGLPQKLQALSHLDEDGVDLTTQCLYEANGKKAILECSIEKDDYRDAEILLDNAYIILENFWKLEKIKIYDYNHHLIQEYHYPFKINGFEYQILSFIETIKKGKIENSIMPSYKTIEILEIMDKINDLIHFNF